MINKTVKQHQTQTDPCGTFLSWYCSISSYSLSALIQSIMYPPNGNCILLHLSGFSFENVTWDYIKTVTKYLVQTPALYPSAKPAMLSKKEIKLVFFLRSQKKVVYLKDVPWFNYWTITRIVYKYFANSITSSLQLSKTFSL